MNYTIHPLILGSALRPRDPRGSGGSELIEAPVISYFLTGGGHRILVDTGGAAPDGVRWMPYFRKPEQDPVLQLDRFGCAPEEIDTVILTHLHWDHTGNNHLYPNAKFFVQRREYEAFLQNIDLPCYDKVPTLSTTYELLDGDTELYSGLQLLLMPGHTPGFQCVIIETSKQKHIILGDTAAQLSHWLNTPRLIQDPGYDTPRLMKCITLIDSLGAILLPGHDMSVFSLNTYPK